MTRLSDCGFSATRPPPINFAALGAAGWYTLGPYFPSGLNWSWPWQQVPLTTCTRAHDGHGQWHIVSTHQGAERKAVNGRCPRVHLQVQWSMSLCTSIAQAQQRELPSCLREVWLRDYH